MFEEEILKLRSFVSFNRSILHLRSNVLARSGKKTATRRCPGFPGFGDAVARSPTVFFSHQAEIAQIVVEGNFCQFIEGKIGFKRVHDVFF